MHSKPTVPSHIVQKAFNHATCTGQNALISFLYFSYQEVSPELPVRGRPATHPQSQAGGGREKKKRKIKKGDFMEEVFVDFKGMFGIAL